MPARTLATQEALSEDVLLFCSAVPQHTRKLSGLEMLALFNFPKTLFAWIISNHPAKTRFKKKISELFQDNMV